MRNFRTGDIVQTRPNLGTDDIFDGHAVTAQESAYSGRVGEIINIDNTNHEAQVRLLDQNIWVSEILLILVNGTGFDVIATLSEYESRLQKADQYITELDERVTTLERRMQDLFSAAENQDYDDDEENSDAGELAEAIKWLYRKFR